MPSRDAQLLPVFHDQLLQPLEVGDVITYSGGFSTTLGVVAKLHTVPSKYPHYDPRPTPRVTVIPVYWEGDGAVGRHSFKSTSFDLRRGKKTCLSKDMNDRRLNVIKLPLSALNGMEDEVVGMVEEIRKSL